MSLISLSLSDVTEGGDTSGMVLLMFCCMGSSGCLVLLFSHYTHKNLFTCLTIISDNFVTAPNFVPFT